MTKVIVVAVAVAALTCAGCGGNSSMMTPSTPSPVSTPAPATGSTSTSSMAGTWVGSGRDSSSSALGMGAMMGQPGLGAATWQLTQSGSNVTGTVTFEGMHGRTGTITGMMAGDQMTFTMNLPGNGMMGSNCQTEARGAAHMDPDTMTLNCTYSGTNSCWGPFMNGQMTMAHR